MSRNARPPSSTTTTTTFATSGIYYNQYEVKICTHDCSLPVYGPRAVFGECRNKCELSDPLKYALEEIEKLKQAFRLLDAGSDEVYVTRAMGNPNAPAAGTPVSNRSNRGQTFAGDAGRNNSFFYFQDKVEWNRN